MSEAPARSPEEQALLAGIIAAPEDDARRLVYADWLEEHGDEKALARAEFIRLHIAWCRQPEDGQREPLLAAWRAAGLENDHIFYDRGFDALAGFEDIGDLCNRGKQVFAGAPRRMMLMAYFFRCSEWEEEFEEGRNVRAEVRALAPELETVIGFGGGMRRSGAYGDSLDFLLDLPQFAGLQMLHFPEADWIGDHIAKLVAARPHLANLQVLDLTECELSDEGLAALSEPHLSSLRSLRAGGGEFDGAVSDDGIATLVRSPYLTSLTHLDLSSCEDVTDRGLRRLLRWPRVEQLTYLDIGLTEVTADGLLALTRCRRLVNLRGLRISGATDAVIDALLRSKHLSGLERLLLADEGELLSPESHQRLVQRFGPPGALRLNPGDEWAVLPPPICEADRIARRVLSQETWSMTRRGPEWRVL
jgi:uncharacterized protein (TIGR02996 family)